MELQATCRKCGRVLTLCKLFDVNGNRHVWQWCESCYQVTTTVPKERRPVHLNIDDLPLYKTKAQRGLI